MRLPLSAAFFFSLVAAGIAGEAVEVDRLSPRPPVLRAADFRLPASQTLPQVESYQQVIFSGSVSGIPLNEGLDRITAPPITAILRQRFQVRDEQGRELVRTSPADLIWEPGRALISSPGESYRLEVEQVALREPQGFVLRAALRNTTAEKRTFKFVSLQQPSIRRPKEWTFGSQFGGVPASGIADRNVVVHSNPEGAVAFGMPGAAAGATNSESALSAEAELAPGAQRSFVIVIMTGSTVEQVSTNCRRVIEDPTRAIDEARRAMQADIDTFLTRLPALSHPNPRVMRFYHQAALQLLYARWKVGKVLLLDPWYPSLGLDSGGLNSYAWDFGYSAVPLTLLDPAGMRAMLVALLGAPLSEHFSIEPIRGEGSGPFYSYSPYAFTWGVDQYLRVTGDRSILDERIKGKTVLEWLIALAQYGEGDRDPDRNNLLDYGDDHNLLELKKTGDGYGYIHEVPSPNGERSWVYRTLADILEEQKDARHQPLIRQFRSRAGDVEKAVNSILWLDDTGWYGTRQKDGKVVPVWSIQIFDLLRIPGLVPPERARRLVKHLNDDEFLGRWGMRSMSIKDRLFDYRDHDWAGPMTYIGDPPQIVADLFSAGFVDEAWRVFERFLWWPEHLAVYPQGVANEDYTFKFPQAARFGGRIGAGRTNEISGSVGVEAIVRGLFGVNPGRDGSIGFSAGRRPDDGPCALAYPFRGKIWNVTQRREGLDVARDDGFGATLFREDGSLWFQFTPRLTVIRAAARLGGPGRLTIGGLGKGRLSARVNGRPAALKKLRGRWILDLADLGGRGVQVDLVSPGS